MVFRDTQLGRFGGLCTQYFGRHGDADIRAAHVLASNGQSGPRRPDLVTVLGVFKAYFQTFNLVNLHSSFQCVWL